MAKDIYISGPMRGHPENNRPAFQTAATAVCELGHNPILPHDIAVTVRQSLASQFKQPTIRDYFQADVLAVIRRAEAILMIKGWHLSKGAICRSRSAFGISPSA